METIEVTQEVSISTSPLPPGYVSVKDAARLLGVTGETVRRYIADGKLAAKEVTYGARGRHGWRWVIPTSEVNRLRTIKDANGQAHPQAVA